MTNRFKALLVLLTKRKEKTTLREVLSEEWFQVPHINEDF